MRRALSSAVVLGVVLGLGIAADVPSYAAWSSAQVKAVASVAAGTLVAAQSGFTGTQTFSTVTTALASPVTITNSGSVAGTFSAAASVTGTAAMITNTTVFVWPTTAANPCTTTTAPAGLTAYRWNTLPAQTGTLGASASTGFCYLSQLPAANQATAASIAPVVTTTLRTGTAWSSSATGSTTLNIDLAPSAPTTLTASGTNHIQTTLTWSGATDAVGVTGYRIYVSTNGGTTYTLLATQSASPYTATNLNPLETYTFAVAAIDAAGNESPKKTVTVTTATPVSTQYYRILNDKSGQCLDVYQANTGNTELIQWPCKTTGTENQEWEFTASGGGYRVIPRQETTQAWIVNSAVVGSRLLVQTNPSGNTSRWVIAPIGNSGSYQFKSVSNQNMCVSIVGASTDSEARVELQTCNTALLEQTFTVQVVQ